MPAPVLLRIASLNTWKNDGLFPARLAPLGEQLRDWALDLLLLQECFARLDGDPICDTAARLRAATGLHHGVAAPARRARRLAPGPGPADSTSGLAILSRHPVRDSTVLPLPSRPEGGERLALLARVETPAGLALVANLHLSHLRDDDDGRRAQLAAILAHPWWHEPAVLRLLGGDFNATLAGFALDPLRTLVDFAAHDLLAALGPMRRSLLRMPPERGPICVDHLFALAHRSAPPPRTRAAALRLGDPAEHGAFLLSDHAAPFVSLELDP